MIPVDAPSRRRRCRALLGTFVEIAVPTRWACAIDDAFAAVLHVHRTMSFHDEASDLAKLRRAAPATPVRLDPGTIEVLRIAKDLHAATGGLFEICHARSLVEDGLLPAPVGVGWRDAVGATEDIVIVDDFHARCDRSLLVDLGGIAKGYAVDRAVETLVARDVPNGIVNAGGDLRVFGDVEEMVHLRAGDGTIEGAVMLADGALASSASPPVTRSAPRTALPHRGIGGEPMRSERAVSVAAPTCVIADAMTKVAMADPALAARLLVRLGGFVVDRSAAAIAA